MVSSDAVVWLLAAELVAGAVGLALLGFYLWKARALVDQLTKLTAGANWTAARTAEAFAQAATSIEQLRQNPRATDGQIMSTTN